MYFAFRDKSVSELTALYPRAFRRRRLICIICKNSTWDSAGCCSGWQQCADTIDEFFGCIEEQLLGVFTKDSLEQVLIARVPSRAR